MFRALDTEAVYITKRIQHTTLAIAFAFCVVFGLMPLAGAVENTNSDNIELDQYSNLTTDSNNIITNVILNKLSQEEATDLQSWLKSKNITATINDGNLTIGATGENVKSLQKWLQENNFYNGEIDGNFGTDTETAVKAFQKEVGLLEDGKVGYYTLLAMEDWDEYAETVTNTVSASSDEEKDYSTKSTRSTKKKSKTTRSTKTYKKSYTTSRYRGYTNGMDCWAMSSYLSSKLKSQGYTTRTIQYATSMSSRHRSVQYYSNGAWVNYDYAGNGYSSVYSATRSSGTVVG